MEGSDGGLVSVPLGAERLGEQHRATWPPSQGPRGQTWVGVCLSDKQASGDRLFRLSGAQFGFSDAEMGL